MSLGGRQSTVAQIERIFKIKKVRAAYNHAQYVGKTFIFDASAMRLEQPPGRLISPPGRFLEHRIAG